MSAASQSHVQTQVQGEVVELRMARPPVNALDPKLCADLREALASAIAGGARGIVLSGAPKVFSAGLDVRYLVGLQEHGQVRAAWQAFFETARDLAASPVPVVAALTGHAPAGGCVLALCCDYRVMASGPFRIGLNETRIGLVVPEGIQRLLRRVVGPYRAERMVVAGDMVEVDEAVRIGLVDEQVEIDNVVHRSVVWLEQLLLLPGPPLLQTRALARADLLEAMQPRHIDLDRFMEDWSAPHTQAALCALVDSLGK